MRTYRFFLPLVVLLCALTGCGGLDTSGLSNADAAQRIFLALGSGDDSVQNSIDWDLFRVDGHNIAAEYRQQTTDQGRRAFRDECVASFPTTMSANGYNPNILTDWKQESEDANWVVVSAIGERGRKTILTLSKRDNQRRLAAIDFPH